jgi:hypothetical protein
MKTILLIAGAAAIGLTAGVAQAVTHHHSSRTTHAGAYALPAHPIAYTDLNAYMKATPRDRASRDWQTAAATGSSVNTDAATVPAGATAATDTKALAVNPTPSATPAPTISPDVPAAPAPVPVNPAPSNASAPPAPAPPAPPAAAQPMPQ